MDVPFEDRDRKILPRWRLSAAAISGGETYAIGNPTLRCVGIDDRLASAVNRFAKGPSYELAAEAVGAAIVADDRLPAKAAAEFLFSCSDRTTVASRELARRVLGQSTALIPQGRVDVQIAEQKKRVRHDPRNTLAWIDLARGYATNGQTRKAKHAIEVGLLLAPDNRFVLRSATRFFLHANEDDRALAILLRAPSTPYDPWLLAAETAVAELCGTRSQFYKSARAMLENANSSDWHVSELASAVATLELSAGASRKARKLFRRALKSPTENSVAQARWASEIDTGIVVDQQYIDLPGSSEARAWGHFGAGQWDSALSNFEAWHTDQPFSSKPCSSGSFVAIELLGDYDRGLALLNAGFQANPTDPILINNRAYCLIETGQGLKAAPLLAAARLMDLSPEQQIVHKATRGMLFFRMGEPETGREFYVSAAEQARVLNKPELLASALLHRAYEECRSGMSDVEPHLIGDGIGW
jgi:tetratricopeptide (TPR) repeat protein